MDQGAHFFRCDFQVHTPRDRAWTGPDAVTVEERGRYADQFVAACRERGLHAVAITDHHCMTFLPYIRAAAARELSKGGTALEVSERLVVFPGIELTLGVPCQAIIIFDADFPEELFPVVMAVLAMSQSDGVESKVCNTVRLDTITTLGDLKAKLDEHVRLRGRYTLLPNVTDEGQHSLLRSGQQGKYIEMPCVGGYTDGHYARLRAGTKNKIEGRDAAWGKKKIACIQTSDSRRADHTTLGEPSTWIKWATPSAEALRQACLAAESRVSHDEPRVPETYIAAVSVSNSGFLGPLDIAFNPQYSSLIGGRGTGKSTALEYIRWVLCDQPPDGDGDDAPNYQARRSRLIETTLKRFEATVDVTYVLNGVRHVVRRASVDGRVEMKIGSAPYAACTEADVRALLPIQAYSQKQLSDVSVRVDELTRFITGPIRGDLDRLERLVFDRAARIRETYASLQRHRELTRTLHNRELEERSISEQANAIRASLTGFNDDDRSLIEKGPQYNEANGAVASWKAGLESLRRKADDVRQLAETQRSVMRPVPAEPVEMVDTMQRLRAHCEEVVTQALRSLEAVVQAASTSVDTGAWAEWETGHVGFQAAYTAAMERSSSQADKLQQLQALEKRSSGMMEEMTRVREQLATLSRADAEYRAARGEWLAAQAERDALIDRECVDLSERSGDLIRVSVKRFSDASVFVTNLRTAMQGSRLQTTKLEMLGQGITDADVPETAWMSVLAELEALASHDAERGALQERPKTPVLVGMGLNPGDLERIAKQLTSDTWLGLSLILIGSVPNYEFRTREGQYIPFANASAGQQATALLKTLLAQQGPPLIIDQPEEDLDNPVMLEIVGQIWEAKKLRQIIFASHNANLVVNGDAELVAWFGYRVEGDQSRGMVQGIGAIDVPAARDAIKQIMEGGESAFRLRRDKYGF